MIDKTVYLVKKYCPWVYVLLALLSRFVTWLLFGSKIKKVASECHIDGKINGRSASIDYLGADKCQDLLDFIKQCPDEHLKFFHPHNFDKQTIAAVLNRTDMMTYGLWVDSKLCAYALLKLFPTKKAYIGRLVSPEMAGCGIGKFLSKYLYWQAYLLGFQPGSTISRKNLASLNSHKAIRDFKIVAELPDDFIMINIMLIESDSIKPELML